MAKVTIYGEAGVGWIWIVDPRAHTLEVLRREDGGRYVDPALARPGGGP